MSSYMCSFEACEASCSTPICEEIVEVEEMYHIMKAPKLVAPQIPEFVIPEYSDDELDKILEPVRTGESEEVIQRHPSFATHWIPVPVTYLIEYWPIYRQYSSK